MFLTKMTQRQRRRRSNKKFTLITLLVAKISAEQCPSSGFEGCLDCTTYSETICNDCDDGYVLYQNNCLKCHPSCKTCVGLNTEFHCSTCADGFTPTTPGSATTACTAPSCDTTCQTCAATNSPSQCTSCSNPATKVNAGGVDGAPGTCTFLCASTMYPGTTHCLSCNTTCSACCGGTDLDCHQCLYIPTAKNYRWRSNNKCGPTYADGFYPSDTTR